MRSVRWVVGVCLAIGSGVACRDAADRTRADADTTRPRASARPHSARADSLLRLGDSTYRESPAQARQLWTLARDAARAAGDSAALARALTGLGQAARQLGALDEARLLGEEALALKLRLGMREELFRSYNALGLLAWNQERLADATALFARAADAARAVGDSVGLAKTMVNAGLVATDRAAFDAARRALEGGRDAARALGDSVTLARALNNLAALDVATGDPLAAIAGLEAVREIARATADSTVALNAMGQLATAYVHLGEPQRAFALLDSALALAGRGARRQEEAENLKLIADLYLGAGDPRHALDYYRRASVLTTALGLSEERGDILRNEARAHAALGNIALARARAEEAARLHRAGGFAYPELADRLVLAELASRDGRAADAEQQLAEARRLAASLDAPIALVRVALAEATVAADLRQWPRVLRVLDAARGTLTLAGSAAEAESFALRARAHAALGQSEAALAAGRQAIAAVERIRGGYASGELRTAYAADRADVYAAQVLLLLRLGRTGEAFDVADAARGRALLEHLTVARADLRRTDGAGMALAREALLRRIDALVTRLTAREARPSRERSTAFAAATDEVRASLVAARAEYEALMARGASSDTLPSALRGAGPRSGVVDDVRRALRPGEVLIEYLVTTDRLLIFAVTPTGVRAFDVAEPATELTARVQLARRLLHRRGRDREAHGVLEALHRLLIAPVAAAGALDGARRLILVPHGALTLLPFAALRDPAVGRYVAERYAVLHLPTSGSLAALRAAGGPGARRDAGTAVEVFAPFPDSLPATRAEAASVARALRPSAVHLGASATETRFRHALRSGASVHVATHARLNGRNPLFSYLSLAAEAGSPSRASTFELHELLGLRVAAPLVFLSGCETALGRAWATSLDAGEDYATLAQTLLFAGARDVVATLWRIDDAGAADFAARFYAALGQEAVPEAAALAQRAMLADARYRSPYYWAAYVASGAGVGWGDARWAMASDRREVRGGR